MADKRFANVNEFHLQLELDRGPQAQSCNLVISREAKSIRNLTPAGQ